MSRAACYYVHESLRAGEMTVTIHREDCIRCNHGTGEIVVSVLRRGEWHEPYASRKMALPNLHSAPPIMRRTSCACVQ